MSEIPPFVGDFSNEDVAWMIAAGTQRKIRRMQAIITEGKHPRDLFVILKGEFLVSSDSKKGLGGSLHVTLGPGEIVGEISYSNGQPPRASVRALRSSVVLAVPRYALDRKIAEDLGFALRFHKVINEVMASRMMAWTPPLHPPPPVGDDASLRVYELIEKMLRGEFP